MPRWLCRERSPKSSSRCLPRASTRSSVRPSSRCTPLARPRGFGVLTSTCSPPIAASIRLAARRIVSPSATGQARAVQRRRSASATLPAAASISRQRPGSGSSRSLAAWKVLGQLGPARRGLGCQRCLGPAGLLEEARVHEAEGAAAGAAPLDHLVAEAGAPLPVLGDLGPAAGLRGEAVNRAEAGELAELGGDHRLGGALDRGRDRFAQLLLADPARGGEHVAGEGVGGVAAVAGPVEVLQPRRRLQLLEAGVGEVGELLVVAGEDHRVAGEVGRVAVVVEVVEVGEQQHRLAGVDLGPRRLPGPVVALVEGAQLQRRAGQLAEVLLEPGGAAVEPAARRGVLEGDVVEAGAGAEAEGHLLADLGAVEAEQVAQGGRAAVVARRVGVAGDRGHGRDID